MKKTTIAVIAIITTLAIAVTVLLTLNWNNIQERQRQLADGELHLTHHTVGEIFVLTATDLEALEPQVIQVVLQGGGLPGVDREFRAVPFRDIMAAFIPYQDAVNYTVVFAAANGFAAAMPQSEAMQGAYIALCNEDGPFRLILPGDQFAQRWVRRLTNIDIRL